MRGRLGVVLLFAVLGTVRAEAEAPPSTVLQEAFWVKHPAATVPVKRAVSASAVAKKVEAPVVKAAPVKPAAEATPAKLPDAQGALNILGAKEGSTPWSIVIGLTLLTLLPAILLAMTPMVRLLVVFHFLRQALGTNTAPSNQVLMGLALMMTWFLMQPVMMEVDQQALTPFQKNQITAAEAVERGAQPVKEYMLHYAREKDLALFVSASHAPRPASPKDLSMPIVVPAYMLSELKAGFTIGAVLFLPFLLVDFLVASVTTSVGMLQLSPSVISTPVKILLFVMVDGWSLLADQLLKSFGGR